jgi:hypothetical protein
LAPLERTLAFPRAPMRAVFVIYVVLIAAGLLTFTIIGLTHH